VTRIFGSDQPNVLIYLEFFDQQTAFRALIRHFDRPFGRLTSTPAWKLPLKPLFLSAKNPINLQESADFPQFSLFFMDLRWSDPESESRSFRCINGISAG
jgi:hypothetical protein